VLLNGAELGTPAGLCAQHYAEAMQDAAKLAPALAELPPRPTRDAMQHMQRVPMWTFVADDDESETGDA
jgi:hypothetical protein